jgi:hypothetical protein
MVFLKASIHPAVDPTRSVASLPSGLCGEAALNSSSAIAVTVSYFLVT